MTTQSKQWKVGDRYSVIEDGKRIVGKIRKIDWEGFHIEWNTGEFTIEDAPDPAQSRFSKEAA